MICTKVLVFAVALAIMPAAFGQDAGSRDAGTREELKQLDHKVLQAEKNRNVPLLEQLFAPGYTLTFPNGEKNDKEHWLAILKGPDHPIIESIDASDIHVHLFGDVAVLMDTTTLRSHDSKGHDTSGTFHVLRVMVRQRGAWRVAGVEMSPPDLH